MRNVRLGSRESVLCIGSACLSFLGSGGKRIEKGVACWPPLFGLLQVLVVVIARGRRCPPQLEALPAIDRLVRARLEGDFGISATFRADRRKHLARSAGVAPTAAG